MIALKGIGLFYNNCGNGAELEHELALIRQPIWDYDMKNCPSFANQDCDVSFTEIFSDRILNTWEQEECSLFETKFNETSTFKNCGCNLSFESKSLTIYAQMIEIHLMFEPLANCVTSGIIRL